MVLMGINGLYVMKQAGFCVDEGRGKLELVLMHAVFCGHNSGDQLTRAAK
jgi:hypothetical protein